MTGAWLVFIFCLHLVCISITCEKVKISQGQLQGVIKYSRNNSRFIAFLGIPYALPPVGDLRLQDPVPHPGWQGVRNASMDAPVCAQDKPYFPDFSGQIYGQEDCLFLNVYTRKIDRDAKLPVMVFIHGGGYIMGEASSTFYGPEYFMSRNIVLVTVQYRVGVLGFLSFGDDSIPGNFGLKDQVLALKWVQENIQNFGGDPSTVTIFGESAGGASVNFHLVSPMSKGLFHRAILQSGASSCPWAIIPERLAQDRAAAVATLVACPTSPTDKVLECLKKLPVETFVTVADKFFEWSKTPMIRFGPVIERSPAIRNKFLPKHPLHLPHKSVPIIIGINFKEGGIVGAPLCSNDFKEAKEMNEDLNKRLVLSLAASSWIQEDKRDEIAKTLMEFYMNNEPPGEATIDGYVDMITDLAFAHCSVKTCLHHKSYGPAYFYLYNYDLPISFNSLFGNCSRPLGVSHADELLMLFNMKNIFDYEFNEEDVKQTDLLLDLWTSFAKNGVPTGAPWSPVKSSDIDYLYLARNVVTMQHGLFTDRINLVNSLPLVVVNDPPIHIQNEVKTEL